MVSGMGMWSKFLRWRTAWRVVGLEQSIIGIDIAEAAIEESALVSIPLEATE